METEGPDPRFYQTGLIGFKSIACRACSCRPTTFDRAAQKFVLLHGTVKLKAHIMFQIWRRLKFGA